MDVELDNMEVTSNLNKITFISAIEAETRSKQVEEQWGLLVPSWTEHRTNSLSLKTSTVVNNNRFGFVIVVVVVFKRCKPTGMERTREKTIATQFGSLKTDGWVATRLADKGKLILSYAWENLSMNQLTLESLRQTQELAIASNSRTKDLGSLPKQKGGGQSCLKIRCLDSLPFYLVE